ncbi:isochorismate synthase [Flavobacterium limnosediminis JC2902]|uniref:isochorismate synthase n=1 Tax=Flavobacterium limnosediminis JC2902 TaxID=1341181 RepID=V6SVF1_9FLAO|nr:isochorismate synthase [Flavobacterium limnosediminis]ESU28410.1 isochorismate synthase [Flavobacterium limnosediminis JC2902]
MTDLFLKVKTHQEQQLPFVLYSKPNAKEIVGLFQRNDHLYFVESFEENGFVFAPFDSENYVLLPENHLDVIVEHFESNPTVTTPSVFYEMDEKAKHDFEQMVEKAVADIHSGHFKKVVLSREEIVNLDHFDVTDFFQKLLHNYPQAFKYCFFHPKVGLWMGATPEQLLKVKDFEIHTVALAGTKVNKGKEDVVWKQKEKDEQQLVTDFILENLKDHVSEQIVSSPYTAYAGNLLHIKTDISAKMNDANSLKQVLKILHPTPAVCGYPKLLAKDFILQNEGYDREYYAGFLGELNMNFATGRSENSDLFVNLRCMKIKDKKAHLFVGCGITKDSDPEKEFLETVNKSMTMKKILN